MDTTAAASHPLPKVALLRACEVVGGQSELARRLGLKSQGTVSGWLAAGRAPAERVIAIEAESGVPRYDLRPDIYPRDTVAA